MVHYECFRCGYSSKFKSSLINHLNRKNVCKATEDDVEIDAIKDYYGFTIHKISPPNHHKNPPNHHQNPPNTTFLPQNTTFFSPPNIHQNPPKSTKTPEKIHQNPPKSTKNYACKYCNRIFSRSDSLNRHYTRCKGKKETETLVISQNEEMVKMKKQIEELESFKIQTQNNTTNNNCTNNSHNTTNNTININNYGNENLKHLRSKDFAKLLDGIYNAVPKLIEKIHFDPKHPENQNIKYTNQKSAYLKIVKSDKWQLVNKKHELLDLIDNKCFMLKEKYYDILEKKKYNITEIHRDKIEEFINKYHEEDKKMMLDLIERTELMLLNNS
tara:strand:+ start:186 stop:1169 length:984 start_codon:yes stop_codon:yes gene_type:complete